MKTTHWITLPAQPEKTDKMESKKHTTENQNLTQKIKNRELRIVKNRARVKSNVWDHFGVIVNADKQLVDGFAACKKCKRVLAYDSQRTGTSSLKKHIGRCTVRRILIDCPAADCSVEQGAQCPMKDKDSSLGSGCDSGWGSTLS